MKQKKTQKRYYCVQTTANRYDVSVPTIWRWVKLGKFPSPIKFSPGCSRWNSFSLEAWDAEQEAK